MHRIIRIRKNKRTRGWGCYNRLMRRVSGERYSLLKIVIIGHSRKSRYSVVEFFGEKPVNWGGGNGAG